MHMWEAAPPHPTCPGPCLTPSSIPTFEPLPRPPPLHLRAPAPPCLSPPPPFPRYLGCANMDCPLCKHNPHKTCAASDNFDEAYADNQVLRARCDADVCVELYNASTGEVFSAPGVEVQVRHAS